MDKKYHGKLLLTGEYFVLDGVPALAIPTNLGQRFKASLTRGVDLNWRAYDHQGEKWFHQSFPNPQIEGFPNYDNPVARRIVQILQASDALNPGALNKATFGVSVTTRLEFPNDWGLGSSSTLIAGVGEWLGVNPYALLEATFGGSGYDLACAIADGPIIYTRNGLAPRVETLYWQPEWTSKTHFVHRNQKQNSREGIQAYRSKAINSSVQDQISLLTRELTNPQVDFVSAKQILAAHEALVADTLQLQTIQEELFPDFPGQLKSLGAWGGDFFWALSDESSADTQKYFNERGYETVIPYNEMILSPKFDLN